MQCAEVMERCGIDQIPPHPKSKGDAWVNEIIFAYCNLRFRKINPLPRKIIKAIYEVPAGLKEGEDALLKAVENGECLGPYQSKQILNPNSTDLMLNDFGIHHFHLGLVEDDKKTYFKQRTGSLLFAVVTNDTFYSLGVFKHGQWGEEILINTIHKNWPELLDRYRVNTIIDTNSNQLGNDGRKTLREFGMNVPIKVSDGTVYLPTGGGSTISGHSEVVVDDLLRIDWICRMNEKRIRDKALEFQPDESSLALNLIQTDQGAYVVSKCGGLCFGIGEELRVSEKDIGY